MAFLPSGSLQCFRISDQRRVVLDGMGAYLHGARWSSKGRRVIYAAETYAGAVLETLVHANIGLTSSRDAWIEITVPSSVPIETIQSDEIPGWDAANLRASRAYGDRWYQERRTAVLLVPSLVTRGIERNVLLNQEHPGFAGISATDPRHVHWDALLFTH